MDRKMVIELLNLIEDGNPPKKVRYGNDTYIYREDEHEYRIENDYEYLFYSILDNSEDLIKDFLEVEVEVLPDGEWNVGIIKKNDEQHIKMQFPDTFEEFIKSYSFVDDKEIYTNGCELIPTFRLKQWIEHKKEENDEWEDIEDITLNGEVVGYGILEKWLDFTPNDNEQKICSCIETLGIVMNRIIKNQRKIIERLNKDELK